MLYLVEVDRCPTVIHQQAFLVVLYEILNTVEESSTTNVKLLSLSVNSNMSNSLF